MTGTPPEKIAEIRAVLVAEKAAKREAAKRDPKKIAMRAAAAERWKLSPVKRGRKSLEKEVARLKKQIAWRKAEPEKRAAWTASREGKWKNQAAEKEAARAARIAAWRAERQASCQTKQAQSR